jgi:hypothetical protein
MTNLRISPPPTPNRDKFPFTASVRYRGMAIDIENLDGSVREGTSPDGKKWRTAFKGAHYGELRGSKGTDGDALDIYIKAEPDEGATTAYIVHQNFPRNHPTKAGKFDEDKVVLGVSSSEEAKALYLKHYNRKDFFRSITEMPVEAFKRYAFGENKGEKMARYITESELRSYITDPEKVSQAAKNLCHRPGSAFIRTKMRGDGKMKKTAFDEAYEAGVQAALADAEKTGAFDYSTVPGSTTYKEKKSPPMKSKLTSTFTPKSKKDPVVSRGAPGRKAPTAYGG